jgi:hypothetical protein
LLSTGTYSLTLQTAGVDTPAVGDLDLLGPVRIIGAGEDKTVIHANRIDRGVEIHEGASAFLAHLSVTGGHPPRPEDGGGILNRGTLVAEFIRLHDNHAGHGNAPSAGGGSGGGLANLGRATLTSADIHANIPGDGYDDPSPYPSPDDSDPGTGGAIFNTGDLTLAHSTIHHSISGIMNRGTLSMSDSLISQNTESSALINQGSATISHSTFSNNRTYDGWLEVGYKTAWGVDGGHGGAINNSASLTMTHCTITDNRAGEGIWAYGGNGRGGDGGGIYNVGTMVLDSCLVGSNRAGDGGAIGVPESDPECNGGSGGGIYSRGVLTVTNSTIAGNRSGNADYDDGNGYFYGSGGSGGGIYADNAHIRFSTIVSNSSGMGTNSEEETGAPGQGGGVFSNGAITLTGVVFSANASPADSPSCAGSGVTSLGYNLIEESQGCTITGTLAHTRTDILDRPALLGPLADNGGPGLSHNPTSASPAVDAVPGPACVDADGSALSTDQRGAVRPQGSICDMGSVERIMSAVVGPDSGAVLRYTGPNGVEIFVTIPAGAAASPTEFTLRPGLPSPLPGIDWAASPVAFDLVPTPVETRIAETGINVENRSDFSLSLPVQIQVNYDERIFAGTAIIRDQELTLLHRASALWQPAVGACPSTTHPGLRATSDGFATSTRHTGHFLVAGKTHTTILPFVFHNFIFVQTHTE